MSPAAFQSRTTPLGVVAWSDGIRLYSQADSGDLREACGDLGIDDASNPPDPAAANKKAFLPRNWRAGEAHAPAALGTAIAPVQSSNGEVIRIYYQMPDMRLGELCKDGRDSDQWFQGEYTTDVNLPGTSIAVVRDESLGTWGYHIFFQGQDQAIYQSTHGDQWQTPRKIIDRAMPCTDLSGVSWNGGRDMRLYYQDVDAVVREVGTSNNGDWWQGQFTANIDAKGDIAAVAWDGPHIRLYVQESNFDIVEWAWDGSWSKTDFRAPALPLTDIAAVVHEPGNAGDRAVLLYFVGPDKILHQRAHVEVNGNKSWEPVELVTVTAQPGSFVGQVGGSHFTDLDAGAGDKTIKRVIVNSGSWIDSIQVEYTDGSQTQQRGENGGDRHVFELEPNEDIVQVLVRGNYRLQTIQFITSTGRRSPEYGSTDVGTTLRVGWNGDSEETSRSSPTLVQGFSSDAGQRSLWDYHGQPLAGFTGSADVSVRSLQPIWAIHVADLSEHTLAGLGYAIAKIEDKKHTFSRIVKEHEISIPKMKSNLITAVKPDMEEAIWQTIGLGDAAISLSSAEPGFHKRRFLRRCKRIAGEVRASFDAVYAIACHKLSECDDTATDLVSWRSQADSQVYRVGELLSIAEVVIQGLGSLQTVRRDTFDVASRDLDRAIEAVRRADYDLVSKIKERDLRDIFSLGLGALGDWGGLNSAIESARHILRSAEANVRSADQAMRAVQTAFRDAEQEIISFGNLKSRLSGFKEPFGALQRRLESQRSEVNEIRTTAFDLSVFIGALKATSSPLENIRTAEGFASSIQKLQDIIHTNVQLAGAFIYRTEIMNQALRELIASASDDEWDDLM